MIYMLQDSTIHEISELLEFSLIKPIETVYKRLELAGCLSLLNEEIRL